MTERPLSFSQSGSTSRTVNNPLCNGSSDGMNGGGGTGGQARGPAPSFPPKALPRAVFPCPASLFFLLFFGHQRVALAFPDASPVSLACHWVALLWQGGAICALVARRSFCARFMRAVHCIAAPWRRAKDDEHIDGFGMVGNLLGAVRVLLTPTQTPTQTPTVDGTLGVEQCAADLLFVLSIFELIDVTSPLSATATVAAALLPRCGNDSFVG